ncbi:MAG TPA: J domain-containing protein, partial [Blastocatellia bacterium]
MKDCWTILGILPTGDTAAIRKVYLELVKAYHPDTVLTAEKKREYTILCAEINQAYTQATEQAKTFSAPRPDVWQEAPP